MTPSLISDRIDFKTKILAGKALIKGTRISVEFILELLANDWSFKSILENYPQLTRDDILAALDYARIRVKDEYVFPLKV